MDGESVESISFALRCAALEIQNSYKFEDDILGPHGVDKVGHWKIHKPEDYKKANVIFKDPGESK